jgi:CelD/BcsL family acetyltransferase involved in cellulose biosynthesis
VSGAELISDLAAAEALAVEWDELAVAASNPVAAPAWVLAWWRHVAAPDMQARVVVLREGSRLVGLAPLYLASRRFGVAEYRLMTDDFGVCTRPLALPGHERGLAAAVGHALDACEPRAGRVRLGPMQAATPWVDALRAGWPGRRRPLVRTLRVEGVPVIRLREPSYEEWLATLSSKLRRDLRRSERLFEEAGGTSRWSDAARVHADAEAFARLHSARWEGRGWSRLADLGPRLAPWLEDVCSGTPSSGRVGLCVLELDGETVCVDLHMSAGVEAVGVNVGWDDASGSTSASALSRTSSGSRTTAKRSRGPR